jgi:dihydromethanopterin reductase (acceptor)
VREEMNILWAITGAGHFLEESIEFMKSVAKEHKITIAFSNAGLEVVKMYGFFEEIKKISKDIVLEKDQGASAPFVGKVTKGEYSFLLVAPCTANTIAKIAHGIADTLITNLVAQAVKSKVHVVIIPTDFQKREVTKTPKGERKVIHLRNVDIENVKKVEQMEGIKVVRKLEEIKLIFFKK